MTTYKQVKLLLGDLERSLFNKLQKIYPDVPPCIPTGVANGYAQFFSCENVTEESPDDQECIVVCGVGINYGQGKSHGTHPAIEPWLFVQNASNSWVEDYDPEMRKALDKNLTQYFCNSISWFQNGYASSSGLLAHWRGTGDYPYILIATNLSPFLTEKIWTAHPDADTNFLLHSWNPNDHICKLKQALGDKIDLWVVHGKQAVWPRFDPISFPNGFPTWILTPNLSKPGMIGVGSFWKKPFVSSAWPPSFPYCIRRCDPSNVLDEPVDE